MKHPSDIDLIRGRRDCSSLYACPSQAMPVSGWAALMTDGFRRLKAYKHVPVLRAAFAAHQSKYVAQPVEDNADAA
jgi:hypothetical protein